MIPTTQIRVASALAEEYVFTGFDIFKLIVLYSFYFLCYFVFGFFYSVFQGDQQFLNAFIYLLSQLAVTLSVVKLATFLRDGNVTGSALVSQFISGAVIYACLKYAIIWIVFIALSFIFTIMAAIPVLFAVKNMMGSIFNETNTTSNSSAQSQVTLTNSWPESNNLTDNTYRQTASNGHVPQAWILPFTGELLSILVLRIPHSVNFLCLWLILQQYVPLNDKPRIPNTRLTTGGIVLFANISTLGFVATSLCIGIEGPTSMQIQAFPLYSLLDAMLVIIVYIGCQTNVALEEWKRVVLRQPSEMRKACLTSFVYKFVTDLLKEPRDIPISLGCFMNTSCYLRIFRFGLRLGLCYLFTQRCW